MCLYGIFWFQIILPAERNDWNRIGCSRIHHNAIVPIRERHDIAIGRDRRIYYSFYLNQVFNPLPLPDFPPRSNFLSPFSSRRFPLLRLLYSRLVNRYSFTYPVFTSDKCSYLKMGIVPDYRVVSHVTMILYNSVVPDCRVDRYRSKSSYYIPFS